MRRLLAGAALAAALCPLVPQGELAPARRRPAPLPASPGAAGDLALASWYGPGFQGRPTASGAPYDQEGMTCASRTLPLGTLVRVTAILTGRAVDLVVTDRGPYVDGRALDVSRAASRALGFERDGLAALTVETIRQCVTRPALGNIAQAKTAARGDCGKKKK